MPSFWFIVIVIIIALIFDYINGFHDAANAIATVVATRVLTPFGAVFIAALMNFIGVFIFSVAVAETVGKGIISTSAIDAYVILAALIGAIAWNLITWVLGLPSSSSHALIGGLIGAAIPAAGFKVVILKGVAKVVLFIFIAPVLGAICAMLFTIIINRIFFRFSPEKVNKVFKKAQLVSASFYAVAHGTNDAQKTMGIITVLLLSAGLLHTFYVPMWVRFACQGAIALGTLAGGWRIIKTMGTKITKLKPVDGFAAETSGGIVLAGTAVAGIPVSTTHVIAGSITGVGAIKNSSRVRWTVARKIMWAWILTIPFAAITSALCFFLINFARFSLFA